MIDFLKYTLNSTTLDYKISLFMAIPPWGELVLLHPVGILGLIVQLTGLGLMFYLFNKGRAYKIFWEI